MAKKTRNAIEILERLTGDDLELREMIAEETVNNQVARIIFEARTLNPSDALGQELHPANHELLLALLERGLREMKIDRVLDLYNRGDLSFGAAAERAGISRSDLARHAYARGIEPSLSPETLAEEIG